MLVSDLHSLKALSPMLVTLEGMTISDRELQSKNASRPIIVTLEGMTISDREEQYDYLKH